MPSLLDAAEAFSKLGKKSVEIDQAACVRMRHRHASCMACFQVCAHEAITRDDDGLLAIDNHLCTGCGACASVCPTSALQLIEDVPELVQAAIESVAEQADALQDDTNLSSADGLHAERPCGTLTISCEYLRNQEAARSTEPADRAEAGDALVVPCLAALDESTIIATSCAGVELRYRSADCAICPNAQGSLIAEVSEQAEHLARSARRCFTVRAFAPWQRACDRPPMDDRRGRERRSVSRQHLSRTVATRHVRITSFTARPIRLPKLR